MSDDQPSNVVELADYRTGWVNARAFCNDCLASWVATFRPTEGERPRLECPRCGSFESRIYSFFRSNPLIVTPKGQAPYVEEVVVDARDFRFLEGERPIRTCVTWMNGWVMPLGFASTCDLVNRPVGYWDREVQYDCRVWDGVRPPGMLPFVTCDVFSERLETPALWHRCTREPQR